MTEDMYFLAWMQFLVLLLVFFSEYFFEEDRFISNCFGVKHHCLRMRIKLRRIWLVA